MTACAVVPVAWLAFFAVLCRVRKSFNSGPITVGFLHPYWYVSQSFPPRGGAHMHATSAQQFGRRRRARSLGSTRSASKASHGIQHSCSYFYWRPREWSGYLTKSKGAQHEASFMWLWPPIPPAMVLQSRFSVDLLNSKMPITFARLRTRPLVGEWAFSCVRMLAFDVSCTRRACHAIHRGITVPTIHDARTKYWQHDHGP